MPLRRKGGKVTWSLEVAEKVMAPGGELAATVRVRGLPPGSLLPDVHVWVDSNANHPGEDDPLKVTYTKAVWFGPYLLGGAEDRGDEVVVTLRTTVPVDTPPTRRGGATLGQTFPKLRVGDGSFELAAKEVAFTTLPIHDVVRDAIDALGWSIKKTETWARTVSPGAVNVRWELMLQTEPAVDARLPEGHARPTVRLVVNPSSPTRATTPADVVAVGPDRERVLAELVMTLDLDEDPDGSRWAADLRSEVLSMLDPDGTAPAVPPRRKRAGFEWSDLLDVAFEVLDL